MSIPEDAASVLEQFVHDVANTPAEITHLLEEIQNKDLQISAFKEEISKRDAQLQKWVRVNGGHVPHGKEEAFAKTINDCYDQCEVLQAEKVGLSEKALVVLERQIKRLDVGLRRLSTREEFPADWNGPSLLSGSATGVSTPVAGGGGVPPQLQPVSGNIGVTAGAPNIANAAQIRMAQTAAAGRGGQQTPAATLARSQREGSTDANKRRRLNPAIGNLPAGSSNLRQSSLGPGTPKAGTPVPGGIAGAAAAAASSRAGSAQPSRPTANQKKAGLTSAPGQPPQNKRLAPHHAGANPSRKRSRLTTHKKGDRRRQLTRSDRDRATPSSNASEASDAESDSGASPTPSSLPRSQADGTAESTTLATTTPANPATGAGTSTGPHKRSHHGHSSAGGSRRQLQHQPSEEEEEGAGGGGGDEDDDDELYCYCQKVSYGDMVGCDNADCRFQWFHWQCVGIKSEPEGEWLCPTCSAAARGEVWKGNGLGR